MDLFVYYRIAADCDPQAARQAVRAMQADLPGAGSARLMTRRDDPLTWMEIYPDLDDSGHFEAALEAAWRQHGLQRLLGSGSERHMERFIECV